MSLQRKKGCHICFRKRGRIKLTEIWLKAFIVLQILHRTSRQCNPGLPARRATGLYPTQTLCFLGISKIRYYDSGSVRVVMQFRWCYWQFFTQPFCYKKIINRTRKENYFSQMEGKDVNLFPFFTFSHRASKHETKENNHYFGIVSWLKADQESGVKMSEISHYFLIAISKCGWFVLLFLAEIVLSHPFSSRELFLSRTHSSSNNMMPFFQP